MTLWLFGACESLYGIIRLPKMYTGLNKITKCHILFKKKRVVIFKSYFPFQTYPLIKIQCVPCNFFKISCKVTFMTFSVPWDNNWSFILSQREESIKEISSVVEVTSHDLLAGDTVVNIVYWPPKSSDWTGRWRGHKTLYRLCQTRVRMQFEVRIKKETNDTRQ